MRATGSRSDSVFDRALASMVHVGTMREGWTQPPRPTVRIAEKPMATSLHFKNAAARAKAQIKMDEIVAGHPKGYQISKKDLVQVLRPFVNKVPVYRGALKSMAYATISACITSEEKSNEPKKPV